MFTDCEILKQHANNGLLEEEVIEILTKIASKTIGFDLTPQQPMSMPNNIKIHYMDFKPSKNQEK